MQDAGLLCLCFKYIGTVMLSGLLKGLEAEQYESVR
jgi:hypothetical protein